MGLKPFGAREQETVGAISNFLRRRHALALHLRRAFLAPRHLLWHKAASSCGPGATLFSTCTNLCKNMIGAGLLNTSIAFKYSSVLGGLLAIVFSMFVSL